MGIRRIKKTLAGIVLAGTLALGTSRLEAKIISYSSGYGFPDYKTGLLNKQNNWQSGDSLDNKGWQVINKKSPPNAWKFFDHNILCFKPNSDFKTFSPENNYATFHFHTSKPIKTFTISGEYNIQKNGYIEVYISGDNTNWVKIEHFNSRGRDDYRIGWGSTPYYSNVNPVWRGIKITSHPYTKIKNDLYIRHSSGAKSNKNYEVEIWRFHAAINTYRSYEEKLNQIHFLTERIALLEKLEKESSLKKEKKV